jgi:hypothetical protein
MGTLDDNPTKWDLQAQKEEPMFLRFCCSCCLAVAFSCSFVTSSFGQVPPAFRDTVDTVPAGWSGPVFQLSKDYPTTIPAEPKPWKAFDFKTQPKEYLQAILGYALEGNEAAQWKVQDNAVRKWYHAPGLLGTGTPTIAASGREFIHGLTRERVSPKNELHASQDKRVSNWAVGFFNPVAAYTIGKVWADPSAPNTTGVKFEDGAVAFKLLFTSASETQVPFLANSMKWQANIDLVDLVPASIQRQPRDVLLLQVDVAVRDTNADDTTGWVFGTFMYQNDAPGAGALDRLVPVGLIWGNDPGLTKKEYDAGTRAVQTWLNTAGMPATKSPHFGWLSRLNGPIDNPRSSCLSCHARAVNPYVPGNTVPQSDADADDPAKKFFTNTKAGEVYEGAPAGTASLDYSLQLAVGVRQFPGPAAKSSKDSIQAFNFRSGEPEDTVAVTPGTKETGTVAPEPAHSYWVYAVAGVVVIVGVVLLLLWLRTSKPSGA